MSAKRGEICEEWIDKTVKSAASEYKNTIKALRHRKPAPVQMVSQLDTSSSL